MISRLTTVNRRLPVDRPPPREYSCEASNRVPASSSPPSTMSPLWSGSDPKNVRENTPLSLICGRGLVVVLACSAPNAPINRASPRVS